MRDENQIEYLIDCTCDELIQNDVNQYKESYVKGIIDGLTWVLEEIEDDEIFNNFKTGVV